MFLAHIWDTQNIKESDSKISLSYSCCCLYQILSSCHQMSTINIISPVFLICTLSSLIHTSISTGASYGSDHSCLFMHQYLKQPTDHKFEQKSNRFWEFSEELNTWVEVKLPYDLVSCINDSCKVVNSIRKGGGDDGDHEKQREPDVSYSVLPVRKRVSLTRMSETSVWVTGVSGLIYERFWNGLQWVIAPHELPLSAGYAVSVFIVNQTILALSESGFLYQMQVTEESQPIWVEFMPVFDKSHGKETDQASVIPLSSGLVTNNKERIYFCTKNGSLLELNGIDPPRWTSHGRPLGANVAAIADAATIRSAVLFTLSAAGDLYEYEKSSKPPWKKHIHNKGSEEDNSLYPTKGCSLHGLAGAHSTSLFLLTKEGKLVERWLHQRKWKWSVHGNPKGHPLASITCISPDEQIDNSNSLFLTTSTGSVFEYQIPKYAGSSQVEETEENWLNHMHPPHAKIARGVAGLQMQPGRIVFQLDDGRLAELHLSGIGGENSGPYTPITTKRKSLLKYVWSILDAPETEGWNAEYCTEERGPSNCILGTKDEANEATSAKSASRWRKDGKTQQHYLSIDSSVGSLSSSGDEYKVQEKHINSYFHLRLMQEDKSFFLVTDNGMTFEYLNTENAWFWLKHEHVSKIEGAVGNYNGVLFLVDEFGSLLIRERSSSDLAWTNCTAMRKGRPVIGGPPWDSAPGQVPRAKPEDAVFFVSKSGRLQQFRVAMRKFKWKDCRNPPITKIACIADQEGFRENVVFVIGRNGRLYQYNKVTELWHEHYQSQHLVLARSPGTAMRLRTSSTKGSLFMLSEDGGLVEYRWDWSDGWNWVEHGTPYTNVTLVGAPGPCFGEGELFVIGSDGNVYLRYLDQGLWRWRDCGFPYAEYKVQNNGNNEAFEDEEFAAGFKKLEENLQEFNKMCDPKVTSTRPIPFSGNSVIFELRDGRLGEMSRLEDKYWIWSRTIGTPTSSCMANFWTAMAS